MADDRPDPLTILDDEVARQRTAEAAAKALAAARATLILGRDAASVFFACLVLRLRAEPDASAQTMATDGRVLAYAPEFVAGLSQDELVGVLAHEVMHCALAHPARRAGRDPGRWNVACDLGVNPLLSAAGFALPAGRLVPGEGRYADVPTGLSAEAYYARLSDDPPGDQDEWGESDPGGCGGVRDPGPATRPRPWRSRPTGRWPWPRLRDVPRSG